MGTISLRAIDFVQRPPDFKPDERLVPYSTAFSDLKPGTPVAYAVGNPAQWEGMSADAGQTCWVRGRMVILGDRKEILDRALQILSKPENHPILLSGIEESKSIPTSAVPESVRQRWVVPANAVTSAFLLQAGSDFQYFSTLVVRPLDSGYSFYQEGVIDFARWLPEEYQFEDKHVDSMGPNQGQIQILETVQGTLFIFEFSAYMARVSGAVTCAGAADRSKMSVLAATFGGDRAAGERLKQRGVNTLLAATDDTWACEHEVQGIVGLTCED